MSNTQSQNDTLAPGIRAAVDRLMTTIEASEYLQLPEAQMRQWRHLGRGPAFSRIGRAVRYRRSDLDSFVAAGRVNPSA